MLTDQFFMSSQHSIYLDHNATTPMLPAVLECLLECFAANLANPASQHAAGRQARKRLTEAKETIGRIVGARISGQDRDRVIITSGGTESNNLALRGLIGAPPAEILISAVEHPSVLGAGQWLSQNGYTVRLIPVDRNGVVQPAGLPSLISANTRLVSVMLGNNETGVIQPIAELAEVCHQHQLWLHTDAVQAVGKVDVSFQDLQADAMSLSAHKFHGPPGIGALIVRQPLPLQPLLVGGAQQLGLRPGTECAALVCGMAKALEIFAAEQSQPAGGRSARLGQLRDLLEGLIQESVAGAVVHGQHVPRLPHTSCISFPKGNRQALLMALDRAGVACSSGSACASGSSEPSHVLLAMGCEQAVVEGALRFSLGCTTNEAQVRQAAERILRGVRGQETA
jgi:cysteine desulfurase